MTSEHTIRIHRQAADPKTGLTLGELTLLVQDAHKADLAPDARVTITVGWRQQIRTITVEGGCS